ncbi:MAG: DUF4445 domain-containing protein [Deltaproteobacteria bacterium]|nr:DUF4445 domain-containing protein [Deltaproteobacteria bacterium]
MIKILNLKLSPPSLKDNVGDADRLLAGLKKELKTDDVKIDLKMLKALPNILRRCNYKIKAVLSAGRDGFGLVKTTEADKKRVFAGIAVDLGTTMIALALINLETKEVMQKVSFINPQVTIAADVLARIHYADNEEGRKKLNRLVINGINNNIKKLSASASILPKDIYCLAIAGNTAMTHFFLSLPTNYLIREPYIPAVNTPPIFKAEEIGLELNKFANVFVFPNIGSYFGGDIIAGILFAGMHEKNEISIFTDVGTNAEVVLGNKDWLIGCAGAAGPALEGGAAKIGMQAGAGVIDKVVINKNSGFKISTIDNLPPIGICGSGLIDLAAQLFLYGFIDKRGKFADSVCADRLIIKDEIKHLIIVKKGDCGANKNIMISGIDIDNLIRSKAAMFTILETITKTVGIDFASLSDFFVAGTFGYFINPESAISIGMFPNISIEKYKAIGNSSLKGAILFLTDPKLIKTVDKIRDMITYLELNVNQEFMSRFSGAKFLPHTDAYL